MHASTLSDAALITELGLLAGRERAATVALIVYLAEFDARRLYAGEGYSSTFRYCTDVLHLPEDAAFNRIEVARAARQFPRVLEMLLSGALSPTTARLLARRLTAENQEDLLAAAGGRTRQQVEELLARRFPQPDVPSSIRRIPLVAPPPEAIPGERVEPPRSSAPISLPVAEASAYTEALRSTTTVPRPLIRPLAADRYEVRFTASAETRDLLRRAQDLLGHAVPTGDLDEIFRRALRVLVEDVERKKLAATTRPRRSRGQSEDSRNIPAAVKRAVRERDGLRCAWVSPSGHRCEARRFLEFHHDEPYGVGGKPTVDRIRLVCRTHNDHEARLFYGPMRRYVGAGISESVEGAPPVPGRVNRSMFSDGPQGP